MSAVRAGEAITLSGPPRSMSAVVRLDPPGEGVVPVTMKLAGGAGIFRAHVRPFGHGTSEIRLRLPRETPPGTYNGEGPFGGEQRGIVVEVEPDVRVRVHPKRTALSVEAGSRAPFEITIVNTGNVPIELPTNAVFDLDDAEGQDRALGRALRATLPDGERRVDRFFEEIRATHGGEARVTIQSGAGPLAPGETRELSCVLDVPATVQAGQSYLGAWPLGNGGHVLLVEVTKGAPPTTGRKTG